MRYSEQYGGGNMDYNLNAMEIQRNCYYTNVIGNVWCRDGDDGIYKTALYSVDAVYRFGNDGSSGSNPDPNSEATALIHGNYDYPLDEVIWLPGISHDIPTSLYHATKPAWFGVLAWPAIGPDVSGYLTDIPAKARWDAYVLSGDMDDMF
jgi:hypothetical protein